MNEKLSAEEQQSHPHRPMEDVKITLVDGGNDTAAAATATTKPVVPSTTTGGYVKTESAAVKKRSFQLRALTRKTLAYQKRQTFVNCCCVVICPLLMVAIAALMVLVFQLIRNRAGTAGQITAFLRCMAMNCSDGTTLLNNKNIPKNFSDAGLLTGTTETYNVNYYQLRLNGPLLPCFNVYEDDYAFTSPYAQSPGVGVTPSRDTSFLADPVDGWFDSDYTTATVTPNPASPPVIPPFNPDVPIYSSLTSMQRFPWNYVFIGEDVVAADAGAKTQSATVALEDIPGRFAETERSGLLGETLTQYYKYPIIDTSNALYVPADFFVDAGVPVDESNEFMLDALKDAIAAYEETFYPYADADGKIQYRSPIGAAVIDFLTPAKLNLRYPPYGAIYINELTSSKLNLTLQAGRQQRLESAIGFSVANLTIFGYKVDTAATYPAKGVRMLYQLTRMSNAFLRGKTKQAVPAQISHAFRGFPQKMQYSSQSPVDIAVEIGKTTFPFGLSFLLPIFVLTLVKEKEDRILIMLRMNGLTTFVYYATHYMHFMVLQAVASVVFIITGFVTNINFFINTEVGVTLLLLFIWANTMIAFAMLLSVFFNKSRFALIASFALVLFSCLVSLFIGILFDYGPPPNTWFIWPFWGFYYGLELIGTASNSATRAPYRIQDLAVTDPLSVVMQYLVVEAILLFALTAYLTLVIPTEFGIAKPWHFIFTEPYAWFRHKFSKKNEQVEAIDVLAHNSKMYAEDKLELLEDSDVKAERARVEGMALNEKTFSKYPLLLHNIRKKYATGKVANKAMCLAVDRNIVFGLLGPNGAGKSTLISMMTGIYPPSSGTAFVAGFDIITQMKDVYLNIGVCPQHDILWDDLTVEEHLLFYARLRGITAQEEQVKVAAVMESVALTPKKTTLSKGLSGGQKRRLSIAIAIIGDVPLVFLDEPTTGLDPEVRRNIWDIIQNAKADKTIILTTHSMEEADILSSRIGIMAKGVLRCIGTPLALKRRYGKGFRLTVAFRKHKEEKDIKMARDEALRQIESMLPVGQWRKLEQGGVQGSAIYEFDDAPATGGASKSSAEFGVSSLMETLVERADALDIEDWGISQSSLEEVFLNIVKDEDADASAT